MQFLTNYQTAEILQFSAHIQVQNRLSVTDRIYANEWGASHAAPAGARITIHARNHDDAPEVTDYIGIYRADDSWAVWHLARDGAFIKVWNGPTGMDLGVYTSMKEALAAVSVSSIQPRIKRRN